MNSKVVFFLMNPGKGRKLVFEVKFNSGNFRKKWLTIKFWWKITNSLNLFSLHKRRWEQLSLDQFLSFSLWYVLVHNVMGYHNLRLVCHLVSSLFLDVQKTSHLSWMGWPLRKWTAAKKSSIYWPQIEMLHHYCAQAFPVFQAY